MNSFISSLIVINFANFLTISVHHGFVDSVQFIFCCLFQFRVFHRKTEIHFFTQFHNFFYFSFKFLQQRLFSFLIVVVEIGFQVSGKEIRIMRRMMMIISQCLVRDSAIDIATASTTSAAIINTPASTIENTAAAAISQTDVNTASTFIPFLAAHRRSGVRLLLGAKSSINEEKFWQMHQMK